MTVGGDVYLSVGERERGGRSGGWWVRGESRNLVWRDIPLILSHRLRRSLPHRQKLGILTA